MKTPEEMFNALGNRGDYCGLPNVTMEEVRAIYAEGQTVLRAALNKLRFEATKAAGANPEDWVPAQVDLCQVLEDVSVMLGEKEKDACSPRIYLAARYSRREELCGYRSQLIEMGYNVQARWLDGKHQLSDKGVPIGEGIEAIVEAGIGEDITKLRGHFAKDDLEDVTAAELVISFTEPPRSDGRGGRHVEFGVALARNARVIVVGHRENIFHCLPQVQFCETWLDALRLVNGN